ncbi:MAG: hypothetical protein VYE53_14095 [Planctomycetota bacterium]|nr:hypothetical protein [Planctomycetota bacterium]
MRKYVIHFILASLLGSPSGTAQERTELPSLVPLHQAVSELVVEHYPKATSHVFDQEIGFETATRIYITELVAKYPPGVELPRAPVRGPMDDGVWCQLWRRSGDLDHLPAYQRSEGILKREFFKEHLYYANDPLTKCHLVVTLRLPLKTTAEQDQFVKDLRGLLNRFGTYLSPTKEK